MSKDIFQIHWCNYFHSFILLTSLINFSNYLYMKVFRWIIPKGLGLMVLLLIDNNRTIQRCKEFLNKGAD